MSGGGHVRSMFRIAKTLKPATKQLTISKMPAFTLYGAHGSTATNRVLLTLAEGDFKDFNFVPLTLPKGEQKVSAAFAYHFIEIPRD